MCGACGTGETVAAWENVLAGAGPAQRASRATAANRLLRGRRVRVSTWRRGYVLTSATGGARVAASLDELWAAVGPLPADLGPASGGEQRWAWAALPARWDVQAGVVWLSAAVRGGAFPPSSPPDRIGVRGPDPGAALRRLVAFASRWQHVCLDVAERGLRRSKSRRGWAATTAARCSSKISEYPMPCTSTSTPRVTGVISLLQQRRAPRADSAVRGALHLFSAVRRWSARSNDRRSASGTPRPRCQ
jgi:hypothetical protein